MAGCCGRVRSPAVGHWKGEEMELVGRYAYRPEFRPLLFDYLGARRGQRALDVGSGSAYLARLLARELDSRVTSLDADDAMLAVARRLVSEEGLEERVSIVAGDAYELPFADDSFDLVTSHLLMCILNDPARALQEQMRVTRAGGTVSCVVCFCHTDRLPHYHGRSGLPGDLRIDALRHDLARVWRTTVRPRLLDLDHDVVNQDIVWHFRQAGLLDVPGRGCGLRARGAGGRARAAAGAARCVRRRARGGGLLRGAIRRAPGAQGGPARATPRAARERAGDHGGVHRAVAHRARYGARRP